MIKRVLLLGIEISKVRGDIVNEERGVFNRITFMYQDIPPEILTDKKGKPKNGLTGEPMYKNHYVPCMKTPYSYVIPGIYPGLKQVMAELEKGHLVEIELDIVEEEHDGNTYKKVPVEHLRKIEVLEVKHG